MSKNLWCAMVVIWLASAQLWSADVTNSSSASSMFSVSMTAPAGEAHDDLAYRLRQRHLLIGLITGLTVIAIGYIWKLQKQDSPPA